MRKLLVRLWSKYLIARARWQTRRLLERTGKLVKIQITPPGITLESFAPDDKKRGSLNGVDVAFMHSSWEGRWYFPFWNERLAITISVAGSRPTELQVSLLRHIAAHKNSIKSGVEQRLVEHYRENVVGDANAPVVANNPHQVEHPVCRNSRELRKHLSKPAIQIGSSDTEQNEFKLIFNTSWDEEHDLCVTIRNWQVVSIK